LALMFVDLDGFKAVNDTFGHAAGDAVLKEAAERIKGCLRTGDTVARLQGDEFIVLTPDLEEAAHAMTVAQKVLKALAVPYSVDGSDTTIQGSIGVSIYPVDGRTPEVLLHQADKAMYAAKNAGKNTVKLADPENYPIQMGAAE
ncbi:MAG: diguanylate cyclase, partial [Pseudomonadota bacterium]